MVTLGRTDAAVRSRPGVGAGRGRAPAGGGRKARGRGKHCAGAGKALRGGGKGTALGGIAVGLVIGLAACGNAVAGAGGSGKPAAAPGSKAAATRTAPSVNPGGPMKPAAMAKHVLLCREIPNLTRMVFTRTAWPPAHAREALPAGFTVRNPAVVRRIATILCALPKEPIGVMSCPNLSGGSYRLYFAAPGRPIPAVGIELGGCRVVTGLGPPRSWTTSKALQQALNQGLGDPFKHLPSPLP